MCGRYSLFTPVPDLERRFDGTADREFPPRYNAAPGQDLPVVLDAEDDVITAATWGLVPEWADDAADHRHVNARAETLDERPAFRAAYRRRRCLVPADGFYEWVDGEPYRVTVDGGAFAMAGLWETWTPPTAQADLGSFAGDGPADPEPVRTFTVVTTEPNDLVADLHDRMAVVLPEGEERRWLETGDPDLLAPYPADRMDAYRVSTAVNDVANDSPELVEPVEG